MTEPIETAGGPGAVSALQSPAVLARWNEEGRAADVLAVVLPGGHPAPDAPEAALIEGSAAAQRLGRFDDALTLNGALRAGLRARGAAPIEQARAGLGAVGPLAELGRLTEAEARLADATTALLRDGGADDRATLHAHRAHLARVRGDTVAAVGHEEDALRCRYEGNDAAAAVHHHNLASLLTETGGAAEVALAHRTAAALLALRGNSVLAADLLTSLVQHRAASSAAGGLAEVPLPKDFASLCATLEEAAGVRLDALFDSLPTDVVSDGDEALDLALGRPTARGAAAAPDLAPGVLGQVRSALRGAVASLATARVAGATAVDVAPSLAGLRQSTRDLAPRLADEIDALLGRLDDDPRGLLEELREDAAG